MAIDGYAYMQNSALPGQTIEVPPEAIAYYQSTGWTVVSSPAQPAFVGYEGLAPLIDAKGDLLAGGGNDVLGRVPVGADGRFLVADSSQPLGVRWATQDARVDQLPAAAPVLAVNRIPNPSASASHTAGSTFVGTTGSRLTGLSIPGFPGTTTAYRGTRTGTGAAAIYVGRTDGVALVSGVATGVAALVRASAAGAYSLRLTAGATTLVTLDVTLAADTWTPLSIPVYVPTGALAAAAVTVFSAGGAVSDTLDITLATLTDSTVLVAPFDAAQPGTRPGAGGTELVEPRIVDLVGYARSSVRYIEGTGSPVGKVDAPIGWRYIDTAATLGAIEWISTAPGTGGWRVVFGDTGWRNVASALTNGATADVFWIRRMQDVVYYRWQNLALAGFGGFYTTPSGFAPDSTGHTLVRETAIAGVGNMFEFGPTVTYRLALSGSHNPATWRFAGTYQNLTTAGFAWPTSLPGTAA